MPSCLVPKNYECRHSRRWVLSLLLFLCFAFSFSAAASSVSLLLLWMCSLENRSLDRLELTGEPSSDSILNSGYLCKTKSMSSMTPNRPHAPPLSAGREERVSVEDLLFPLPPASLIFTGRPSSLSCRPFAALTQVSPPSPLPRSLVRFTFPSARHPP